jgi:hypothetical protein
MIAGDPLPWRFNPKEDVYYVTSKDGRAKYVVARSRPTGADSMGHKLYRYWQARVRLDDEIHNLGDEHMIAMEGKEVCEIYDSARLESKPVAHESKNETNTLPASGRAQLPIQRGTDDTRR